MNLKSKMIREIRDKYAFNDEVVLSAIDKVPRHKFADAQKAACYLDSPISIGYGQTMSQPYTVAYMTHLLLENKEKRIENRVKDWKVLEIGTGSGYQAAVLAEIVSKVYTVEIIHELAKSAKRTLKKLGYENVFVREGSGEHGWEKYAPYDAILITAGMKEKPKALFKQLKESGVMVVPIGKGPDKKMKRIIKKGDELEEESFGVFHFVPFVKQDN